MHHSAKTTGLSFKNMKNAILYPSGPTSFYGERCSVKTLANLQTQKAQNPRVLSNKLTSFITLT